jgi:hypothetical protein
MNATEEGFSALLACMTDGAQQVIDFRQVEL